MRERKSGIGPCESGVHGDCAFEEASRGIVVRLVEAVHVMQAKMIG